MRRIRLYQRVVPVARGRGDRGTRCRGEKAFSLPRRCLAFPRLLFLPLLLVLVLPACESSFEPITQEPTAFFGVFGFLDTAADTQFVRVSPVRETLAPPTEAKTARAVTTDLVTGAQVTWRDSLVVLDDGQLGLLFFAQIPVEPGDRYRLEVLGNDGAVTQAVTQIPPRLVMARQSLSQDANRRLIQRVTFVNQTVIPFRLRVRYDVTPPGTTDPVAVSLRLFSAIEPGPAGLQFVLPLETDRDEVLRRLGLPPTNMAVVLNGISLEVEQLSAEWQNPETPFNIENGFGFFGAIARYNLSWTLDAADIARLGYRAPG